ncbi:MAG: bifunctional 4-hydroxy-2-oxoglutarate aldolase/2-dehydro-3-deoxy-phosphogluconate aldolase [Maricaulaceae bacterium]|jgi:2-dehydro-3-deoxyphosphogluconate aldolase/(4S)-4-hydroxy-2-oxoglutarate aldolase
MNAPDPIDPIIDAAPVMAVVTVDDAASAVGLARALVAGGARTVEITLRTPGALDAIKAVAAEVPEAIVGAGTVLNARDYERAVEAGARFVVSPGATQALYDAADGASIPFLPGVATASEIMTGLERGHRRFKFFPAESAGGASAVSSFAGPFADVRFCPTGGITVERAKDYLALPNVACVGGSWLAPKGAIAEGRWDEITALAEKTAGLRGQ